jgi:hypothetical protein
MSIKNKKYRIGDLVTRVYDYKIDSIPGAADETPLGIVLENSVTNAMGIMVLWIVDNPSWRGTRRLSTVKLLRLVNRA